MTPNSTERLRFRPMTDEAGGYGLWIIEPLEGSFVGDCGLTNAASQRVAEKIGLRIEEEDVGGAAPIRKVFGATL